MNNTAMRNLLLVSTIIMICFITNCKKNGNVDDKAEQNAKYIKEEAFGGVQGELIDFIINEDTITCEKINGLYVWQGDMILTYDQLTFADTVKSATIKGAGLPMRDFTWWSYANLWPNSIVYYSIADGFPNKNRVIDAIDHWEKNTPISFIERTSNTNYVEFIADPSGPYSSVGMKGGPQQIVISDSCNKGNVIHEIGHAVGLIHEHSRKDRDDYVKIWRSNILVDKRGDFRKINSLKMTSTFDFNSIMLYPSKTGFEIDKQKPSITKINGTEYKAQRDGLSNGDIEVIKSMYAASAPIVFTLSAREITDKSASFRGKVTFDSGDDVIESGVYYGTSTSPETTGTKLPISSGIGVFSGSVTTLIPNSTYFVKAYATNSVGTSYGIEVSFKTAVSGSETVTDIDGNLYQTVNIGTQVWMAENLKTTKYRNADPIPNITDNTAWSALTTGGYCWFNNDIATFKPIYGALYNWYAVNDSRNIAPSGWHVASDAEWTILTTYLGGESVAGGKLKETGTTHWRSPNVDATNLVDFTALPCGFRYSDGLYFDGMAFFWSSTEESSSNSWDRDMSPGNAIVARQAPRKVLGFSVRCIKD
jgi:uncharacterized protein (TIGR02145 family)